MTFENWERWLLIISVTVSLLLFARDLRGKIASILIGTTDRNRTDRLVERMMRFVREVIFQSRVVGGRPIAGAMHAVVFLGFLAFALETADHFLEPFGWSILGAILGSAVPMFHQILAVVAVMVSIAISGLAFRRFVLVKISPDPKSYGSGFVALLILLLMLTYLNGASGHPLWERPNWWLHAVMIIVFPHLILRSKHFHILMAPVNIYFRTHSLGDYLPMNLDLEALSESEEDISLGLETMKDTSWKSRMDFLTCVECKRCTDQCPAANCEQELNPRGFILAGREMLSNDGPVIGNVITEAALGQCTSCGACEAICPVGIEHLQVLIGAKRAQALATGKGMVATEFLESIERHGNPFANAKSTRTNLIEELGIPRYVPGETEYLLWMGCVWSYNSDARSSLEAMIKVLDSSGVSYGVLEAEACSGHHSRRQGEEMQFQALADENISNLEANKVSKVIAPCPHCLHTMRREYPTVKDGFSVETIHHSELIADLVKRGVLELAKTNGDAKKVTYHDPCYLGRYESVYDAPRDVIGEIGQQLVELPRRRERSFCCGGGSAGFIREQDAAKRVDQARKDEIAASGADVLVTACPECKMMLDAAVSETVDIAEFVALSLPNDSNQPVADS
jgi:Fe-S oxidoreductase